MTAQISHPILRLTEEAFQILNELSESQPEVFYQPDTDFHAILDQHGVAHHTETSGLQSLIPITFPVHTTHKDLHGMEFHRSISDLNTLHLTDHLTMAWLSCFPLREYGLDRWKSPTKRPSNHVRQHYLARNPRYLAAASVAGRPLWMAEIALRAAQQTDSFTAEEAFHRFVTQTEVYDYCIYHEVLRVPTVLSEYLHSIINDEPALTSEGARRLAQDLNRAASARLIDHLPSATIRDIIAASRDHMLKDPSLVLPPQLL